jgi:hypothetical protein
MRIIVLSLTVFLGLANISQAQTQPPAPTKPTSAATSGTVQVLSPKGYAACTSRKYNHAYGENTIIAYRQKEDKYLLKSSKFLKKDYPLFIKGWISEKDCKAVMLRVDAPLEIESLKAKTLLVKSKAKLALNRIYFVSQELPSQLFKTTYLSVHVSDLSDEKKRKSSVFGLVIGTQIHANSLFRLSLELQNDSWTDKLTSATKSILFAGFASCSPIEALTGQIAKIDLCAKLLAGKSSDPNLHIKYSFAPQLNLDFSKSWRVSAQAGLVSMISRAEGFPDNAFGLDIEAGLAYRF